MSVRGIPRTAREMFVGRWQVPVALIAATTVGVALYRMVPPPPQVDFAVALADLALLEEAEDFAAAADAIGNLLALEPPLPPGERGMLHERMTGVLYRAEQRAHRHEPLNLQNLLEHARQAQELGRPDTAEMFLRVAFARLWLGHEEAALGSFRAALDAGLPTDDRRTALRAVVDLLAERPEARFERRRILDHVLHDPGATAPFLWWALRYAVTDALDERDTLRARELLVAHGGTLATSDLRGYREHLDALVTLYEGQPDAAAPVARWVDDWLTDAPRAPLGLDEFGHLPSLNRWLLGRIDLELMRPEDALASFEAALAYQPEPGLHVAAEIGRGLALGTLGHEAAAMAAFRAALEVPGLHNARRVHAVGELQAALARLFQTSWELGSYGAALDYLALAAELTPTSQEAARLDWYERLGRACLTAAAASAGETARDFDERGGIALEHAAVYARFDEPRLADLLWTAAEAYDRAGRLGALQRVLQAFVDGRSDHPRMPAALLQLGRVSEAHRRPQDALAWYQRVAAEYPKLEEAARARLMSAAALVGLGSEHFDEAELRLVTLLTDGTVAPDAAVYREALLTLCELYDYQQRYADEIGRLEDYLRLYPESSDHLRARFMLADAYRRSAYQLRTGAGPGVAPEAALSESAVRFRRAADLYAALLTDLDAQSVQAVTPATALLTRLSLQYRADCYYELNEPAALDTALRIYRQVTARYNNQPAALMAHLQIANVHLRLGDVTEAGRAIERARWLLRSMPTLTQSSLAGLDRDEWERFLDVVSQSRLFEDVFAAAP